MSRTITIASLLLTLACDPTAADHEPADRVAALDGSEEDSTGAGNALLGAGERAEHPSANVSGAELGGAEPNGGPPAGGHDEFEADPDPLETSPSCGVPIYSTPRMGSCSWVRALATTDTRVEAVCSSGDPIVGSCWATSSTHKLFRSYMTEGSFDLVDNGQGFTSGYGWACEWDSNATTTNQHIAMVFCCDTFEAAVCS